MTLGGTAVGIACYFLLTWGGGQMGLTTIAVMGLYITVVCMMNFVDSWALRLINGGASLNYGATRAGGSLSYALGAAIFGMVVSRWGSVGALDFDVCGCPVFTESSARQPS